MFTRFMGIVVLATGFGSPSITAQPLQGEINGEPFVFQFGATNAFLSDETEFFVTLHSTTPPTDPCANSGSSSGPVVIMIVPRETGAWDLSVARNVTLSYDGGNNQLVTDGHLRVDAVTATELRGGLVADGGSGFFVDGEFSATICAE